MKKAFLIIGIMFAAVMASAQNFDTHTFHWGDGTSTTVTTIGSHTYVNSHSAPSAAVYDATDSIGNRYQVGMPAYIKAPEGSGYTVYTREYDMDTGQTTWTKVGRLTVEDVKHKRMKFDVTGEVTRNTYIVYDEYLDYFVDKNINKLSGRKLGRKYGYGFVMDSEIVTIIKK